MPQPIHAQTNPNERQLSTLSLSAAAASGTIARNIGFIPAQTSAPPAHRDRTPASVRYVWPPATTPRRSP